MAVKRKSFKIILCLLFANIICEIQCVGNNELPSIDITEDDIAGIPDPFQSFEQCLGENCEKETNAFVPSETFENLLGDLNSDLNPFLAERQSANIPNAEQPNNDNLAEFQPEYYQRLKTDFAGEPNLEYNTFYNGRADTDPKDRTNADFDPNPEFNVEKDYLVPEERSENSQNNRLYSEKNYLPEARRGLSQPDYYDDRSGQSSPGSIHARSGYSPANTDYRNDHDSLNFEEGEDDHSEEFLDDSRHSDLYDVRNEEDHPNAFDVRSGSGKYDRIESNKKIDLPTNRYLSHRKLSPNSNPRKSEENQFDSMEDPTYKPYSKKIDIVRKPNFRLPSNDYNYSKEPRQGTNDFHDSSEEHDSNEANINRRYQSDYVNHNLYDTTPHENKIFPIPKSNKNYLTVLAKDPDLYATTHHGHEIIPIPKINKKYVRVLSKDSNKRDNFYDTTHHEDEIFPIPKSNKKYLTVLAKHDELGDLYDTHHEDEIIPIVKSNKKYLTLLAKDHDDLYDATHHEDEIFPIPKSNKNYLTVLAKHPINIRRKPIRVQNLRNQHYPKDFPLSRSYKKYLKFLRTGENPPSSGSGLRKYKYYDGEPNAKIINQNIPKNHLAYIRTHPREQDFSRTSNLQNDNSRLSKKYREKLKRLERLYPNTHPIADDSVRTNEKYISIDPANDPFSSEILTSKFVSKKPKTQIPKNYANYLRRLSQEYPDKARERNNFKRILSKLEFLDDQDLDKHDDDLIAIPNDGNVFENKFYNTRIRQKTDKTTGNKPVNLFHLRQNPDKYTDKKSHLNDEMFESLMEKYFRINNAKLVGSHESDQKQKMNDLEKLTLEQYQGKTADDTTDSVSGEPDIRKHYGKIDDGVYVDPHLRLKIKKHKNVIEPLPDFTVNRDSKRNESIVNAKPAKIELFNKFEDKVKKLLEFLDHNQNQTSDEFERKILESKIMENNMESINDTISPSVSHIQSKNNSLIKPIQKQKNDVSVRDSINEKNFSNKSGVLIDKPTPSDSLNQQLLDHKSHQSDGETKRQEKMDGEPKLRQNSDNSIEKPGGGHEKDEPSSDANFIDNSEDVVDEMNLRNKSIDEHNLSNNTTNSIDGPNLGRNLNNSGDGTNAQQPFDDILNDGPSEKSIDEPRDEPNLRKDTEKHLDKTNVTQNEFGLVDEPTLREELKFDNGNDTKKLENSNFEPGLRNKSEESLDKPNDSRTYEESLNEPNLRQSDDFLGELKSEHNANVLEEPSNMDTTGNLKNKKGIRQSGEILDEPKSGLNADILDETNLTNKPDEIIYKPGIERKSYDLIDERNQLHKNHTPPDEIKLRQHAEILLDKSSITEKPLDPFYEHKSEELLFEPKSGQNTDTLDEPNMTDKSLNSNDAPAYKSNDLIDEPTLKQHADIFLNKSTNSEKLLDPFYDEFNSRKNADILGEPNMTENSPEINDEPGAPYKPDDLIEPIQTRTNHTPPDEIKLRQHADILLNKSSQIEKSPDISYEKEELKSREIADILEESNTTEKSVNSNYKPGVRQKSEDLRDEPNSSDKTLISKHESVFSEKINNSLDEINFREKEKKYLNESTERANSEHTENDLLDKSNVTESKDFEKTAKSYDKSDDSQNGNEFLDDSNVTKKPKILNFKKIIRNKFIEILDKLDPFRKYQNPLRELKLRGNTNKSHVEPNVRQKLQNSNHYVPGIYNKTKDLAEEPNMMENTINLNHESDTRQKSSESLDDFNVKEEPLNSSHESDARQKSSESLDEFNVEEESLNSSHESNTRQKSRESFDESNIEEKPMNSNNESDIRQKSNESLDESNALKKPLNSNNESDTRQKSNESLDESNIEEEPLNSSHESDTRQKSSESLDESYIEEKPLNSNNELDIRRKSNESLDESNALEKSLNSNNGTDIRQKSNESLDESNALEKPLNSNNESDIRPKFIEYLDKSNIKEKQLDLNHESDTRQKSSESLDEFNVEEEPVNSSHESYTRQKSSESFDESYIEEKPLDLNHESDTIQKSSESLDESNVEEEPLNSSHESDTRQKSSESLDESYIEEKPLNSNNESGIRQKSNESLNESNALEKPLNSNHDLDIRQKSNESNAKEKPLNSDRESNVRQKSNESQDEPNVDDRENSPISRFGQKEDKFLDEINISGESGTEKPNDLLDESPKYNHESGIRKKGNELPGETYNNREVFLDINPDVKNMVYNTAFSRDDLCIVDGKVARGMDCLNTENDDIIVVSKRRFLDAAQEFSNHYILFLRSLAELYPEIIADGPEFMRLFKIGRDSPVKYIDKTTEIYRMVDEIAREVIKSIYDIIELKLAKMNEDELNIKTGSVNDNLLKIKPVQLPITTVSENKDSPILEEETINNNLGRAGTAYDSGDGRKAYNLGEERITIYNLGERKENAIDLGDEEKALILREEKIDKELEQERKIYHLGDEETADNLGEGDDAGNLEDERKSDNSGEVRKANDLGEGRKAYGSGEERIDGVLEEERKLNSLEESEKTDNLEENDGAGKKETLA